MGDAAQSVGGLAGSNYGRVANSYACGFVHAGSAAQGIGGLAGRSGGSIVNCYASGQVSRVSAPATAYPEMGGLVGYQSSTGAIESCYFLGRNNNVGTQLSDVQMKEQMSFAGWDFVGETDNGTEEIWRIAQGQEYPRLQWEPAS